jgi:oxygen-independent coproporphyrinogen-3 oxidase
VKLEYMTPEHSLYLHIPFCLHRCAYCDFNTYAGQLDLIPAYVDALCNEIRQVASSAPERLPVHTIFFGGGTPSLLSPPQYEQILRTITDLFDLSDLPDIETSLEANPGTVSLSALRDLHHLGFTRISFGVQSFHAHELRQLERIHNASDVLDAVRWARQAGFDNLNLDLIYGLPEQTLPHWQESLRRAVDLAPQHLSLYALTIEPGTPFGRWAARGLMSMPDSDVAADMYESASEILAEQGYLQYEISNWSKPGFQCRHNLQYWRNQPYLGFGAGAHGCANDLRIANVSRLKTYIERLSSQRPLPLSPGPAFPLSPATLTCTRLTPHVEMQETMMVGLRLTREGISAQAFHTRFSRELMDIFGREISELVQLGLLEWGKFFESGRNSEAGKVLRLTKRGRLLGNQVFMRFVDG